MLPLIKYQGKSELQEEVTIECFTFYVTHQMAN